MPGTPKRYLILVMLFMSIWIVIDLLLLGHTEDWKQWLPIIGLTFFVAGLWMRRILVFLCVALILIGVAGVYLHLSNNMAFELEMRPGLSGWSLITRSMTGALPVFAPGSLIPVGLLGLILKMKN